MSDPIWIWNTVAALLVFGVGCIALLWLALTVASRWFSSQLTSILEAAVESLVEKHPEFVKDAIRQIAANAKDQPKDDEP